MGVRVIAGLIVLIVLAVVPMYATGQEEESGASPEVWTGGQLGESDHHIQQFHGNGCAVTRL